MWWRHWSTGRAAMHVIVIGRHALQELIDCADLITKMQEVMHP